MHTDPRFLEEPEQKVENVILSAGRTFRDYDTLFLALNGLEIGAIIVVSGNNIKGDFNSRNIVVKYDVAIEEVSRLMGQSKIVVLPLQDRKISTGQSVLLHAMAMGKAIVVTRTAGTKDYIENMVNGVLVTPGDPSELRKGILTLLEDENLRRDWEGKLGKQLK